MISRHLWLRFIWGFISTIWWGSVAIAEPPLLPDPMPPVPLLDKGAAVPPPATTAPLVERATAMVPLPPTSVAGPAVAIPPAYDDVYRISGSFQGVLKEIRVWVLQQQITPLGAELTVAETEARTLAAMAVQHAVIADLRVQYEKFHRHWRRLATRLQATPGANAWLLERVARGQRADDLMKEVLAFGPGAVYDRAKVLELTGKLVDVTYHLWRVVKAGTAGDPAAGQILAVTESVRRQAADLSLAVENDAAFTEIVAQYQRFCEAWNAAQTYYDGPAAGLVQPLIPEITRLSAALNQELLTDPPAEAIHQRRLALATQVAGLAEELTAALSYTLLGSSPVVRAAGDFSDATRSLELWLTTHASPRIDIARPPVSETLGAWVRLRNQLDRLPRAEFAAALAIADRLRVQWELLHDCVGR